MTSTDLVAVNPATGEAIDLVDATDEQLAAAVDGLADLQGRLKDFGGELDAELLGRLDRRASWTVRVGDPADGVQYEISAASPTAGTEGYDVAKLEGELDGLIARRTIDPAGAEVALERTVTLVVKVPFGHDIDALAKTLQGVDAIADVPCTPIKAEASRKANLRGINALKKVPGVPTALARASVKLTPSARKPKVKPIRKER